MSDRLLSYCRHSAGVTMSLLIVLSSFLGEAPAQAANTVSITPTAQETMWVDSNKPLHEGPEGAWLCYVVKNTSATTTLTNVYITFAGFTGGTHPEYFDAPSDLTRYFSSLAPGAQVPVYYYVDYSVALNHKPSGGGKWTDYTAHFTVSVSADGLTTNPTVYNGTITTDELISALAAGVTQSTALGPGIYVGQILTQTVVYAFGNNRDLFFQPASEWKFQDEVIRLVGSEITAVTSGVTGVTVGEKDALWFPLARVNAGAETITVKYYWQILQINIAQSAHPWAAANSGADNYKYAGVVFDVIGYNTITPALPPLTISKSVNPGYLATPESDGGFGPGIVQYTVTLSNSAPVPIVVDNITDVLPAGMAMSNSTAPGSDVTAANSSSVPAAGATGTVLWTGKNLGYSGGSTYSVPASGTLSLKYNVDVTGCAYPAEHSNSASARLTASTLGPVSSDLYIGILPAPVLELTKTVTEGSYSAVGSTVHYTLVARNTGNGTAGNVSISDNLVTGLSPAYPQNVNVKVGENLTVTGTHIVTQSDLDLGQIDNRASASGTTPTGGTVTATATATISAAQSPSISIVKTGNLNTDIVPPTGAANPGDNITYSFTVTNTGNVTLASVSVSDNVVTGISPALVDSLAPGAAREFTAVHVLTQEDIDNGSVSNRATASGTPPTGPAVTAADEVRVTIPQVASLSVAKDGTLNLAGSLAAPGDNITYTITVTNTGNMDLADVHVTDPLLTVITPASVPLAPGASQAFTGTYIITQADINSGSVSNTATGTGTPPSGPDATGTGGKTVNIPQQKTMSVAKAGTLDNTIVPPADAANVGDRINYSVTVTNTGNVTLTNVRVTDPLMPGGLLPASVTLEPGDSQVFTGSYTLTQADLDKGHVDNTATAWSDQSTPAEGSCEVTLSTNPGIHVSKVGTLHPGESGVAHAGDTITYVFTVTNLGTVTLHNVSITDTMIHSGITPASYATLIPGASENFTASYTLTQADINSASVVNTATASGDLPTPPPPNVTDTDTSTVYVTQVPSLTVDKAGTLETDPGEIVLTALAGAGGMAQAGDNITYVFTVTNTGNVTLTNVRVSDPLVPGVIIPASFSPLVPGQSTTFTATYTLTQADIDNGSVSNTATGTATPPIGTDITGTGSTTVNITQSPDISVVKAGVLHISGAEPAAGDTIAYTITVTNTGNVTLSGVSVEDTVLDSHLSPASVASMAPGVSRDFTATYIVTTADIDLGRVDNIATASATRPGGAGISRTASTSVPLVQNPAMAIVKAGAVDMSVVSPSGVVNVGDKIRYTIIVTNTGNVTLTGVAVWDSLLSNNLVPSWPGPAGTLGAGQSATFTGSYTITQADINGGQVENTAIARSDQVQQALATRTISLAAVAALSLQKTGALNTGSNTYASAGDIITYTFTVTNMGNVTLANVTLTDPRVQDIQPASITSLAPGASATFTARYIVNAQDLAAGSVFNSATVRGAQPGGAEVSGSGSCMVVVPRRSLMGTPSHGSPAAPAPSEGTRPYLRTIFVPATSSLSITPMQATVNQPVTVTAQVSNSGPERSSYTASLKVDGQVEAAREGTINPNSSVQVQFTFTRPEPGNYLVDVNGQKAYVTVREAGVDWEAVAGWIPGLGLILCALGIILVSIRLARLRRYGY